MNKFISINNFVENYKDWVIEMPTYPTFAKLVKKNELFSIKEQALPGKQGGAQLVIKYKLDDLLEICDNFYLKKTLSFRGKSFYNENK